MGFPVPAKDETESGSSISVSEDMAEFTKVPTLTYALNAVIPFIGHLALDRIHNDSLHEYKVRRAKAGKAAGTINKELSTVRRILNLAASVWRDENGLSWLSAPPLIQMLPKQGRKPYPLSWEEQGRLFDQLPDHLRQMALFKVNTGLRQNEVCRLRWDWKVRVPELDTTLFIILEWLAKNGEERIVILNEIALGVIARQRGIRTTHYSAPDVKRLIEAAAERVSRPVLQTILRVESHANLTQTQSTRRPALPKLVVK